MKSSPENLHPTVNKKHGTQTRLTCSIGIAYYFTSEEISCPLPENIMKLEELKFPKRKNSSSILSPEEKRQMQEWGSSNGDVVQPRSGRQETTMTRSETLPENAYFKDLKPIGDADKEYSDEQESDSEILQYDSNEASAETEESDNKKSVNLRKVFETSNENTLLI